MRNFIFVFLFTICALRVSADEKFTKHIDFVLLENKDCGLMDSLFYFDSEQSSYVRLNKFNRHCGGIDVSEIDYKNITSSDSVIIYICAHDEFMQKYTVPIKLGKDFLEDSIMIYTGKHVKVGKWGKKRYLFAVEFFLSNGPFSFSQHITIPE